MSIAFKCDRCGELNCGTPQRTLDVYGRKYELCTKCSVYLNQFLNGAEIAGKSDSDADSEPADKTKPVDYELEYLIFEYSNPRDCETIYSCPYCGKKISSWSLFDQKQENKESNDEYRSHCPACGRFVLVRD